MKFWWASGKASKVIPATRLSGLGLAKGCVSMEGDAGPQGVEPAPWVGEAVPLEGRAASSEGDAVPKGVKPAPQGVEAIHHEGGTIPCDGSAATQEHWAAAAEAEEEFVLLGSRACEAIALPSAAVGVQGGGLEGGGGGGSTEPE